MNYPTTLSRVLNHDKCIHVESIKSDNISTNHQRNQVNSYCIIPEFISPFVAFAKMIRDIKTTLVNLSPGLIFKSFIVGKAIYPILRNMEKDRKN